MDIKDYAQMMAYLTRPRDVVPEPRPMAQGGVIGKPGGVVEPGVMYYGKTVDRKAKWKTTANVAPEKQKFMDEISDSDDDKSNNAEGSLENAYQKIL